MIGKICTHAPPPTLCSFHFAPGMARTCLPCEDVRTKVTDEYISIKQMADRYQTMSDVRKRINRSRYEEERDRGKASEEAPSGRNKGKARSERHRPTLPYAYITTDTLPLKMMGPILALGAGQEHAQACCQWVNSRASQARDVLKRASNMRIPLDLSECAVRLEDMNEQLLLLGCSLRSGWEDAHADPRSGMLSLQVYFHPTSPLDCDGKDIVVPRYSPAKFQSTMKAIGDKQRAVGRLPPSELETQEYFTRAVISMQLELAAVNMLLRKPLKDNTHYVIKKGVLVAEDDEKDKRVKDSRKT